MHVSDISAPRGPINLVKIIWTNVTVVQSNVYAKLISNEIIIKKERKKHGKKVIINLLCFGIRLVTDFKPKINNDNFNWSAFVRISNIINFLFVQ